MAEHVCPCCGGAAVEVFRRQVLGRHEAVYASCTCGSLHVVNAHWLDEAYADPAKADRMDGGAQARTDALAALLRTIPARGRWLDFGCGRGLLMDRLRGLGYDVVGFDPARGFAWPGSGPYALVGAFEVLEHQIDPLAMLVTMRDVLQEDGILVLSTWLRDPAVHAAGWSYLATECGQHVTFPSREGLEALASRAGLTWIGSAWSVTLEGLQVHVLARHGVDDLVAPPSVCADYDGWSYSSSRNFKTPTR